MVTWEAPKQRGRPPLPPDEKGRSTTTFLTGWIDAGATRTKVYALNVLRPTIEALAVANMRRKLPLYRKFTSRQRLLPVVSNHRIIPGNTTGQRKR
jgi:hypothetical protein